VVEVDHGVTPGRDQYGIATAAVFQAGRVEAQLNRLFHRHGLGQRDLGEGFGHALRVVRVEWEIEPESRCALELRDAGVFQARLDGQQADVGAFRTRIEQQFGGAHGGAASP